MRVDIRNQLLRLVTPFLGSKKGRPCFVACFVVPTVFFEPISFGCQIVANSLLVDGLQSARCSFSRARCETWSHCTRLIFDVRTHDSSSQILVQQPRWNRVVQQWREGNSPSEIHSHGKLDSINVARCVLPVSLSLSPSVCERNKLRQSVIHSLTHSLHTHTHTHTD